MKKQIRKLALTIYFAIGTFFCSNAQVDTILLKNCKNGQGYLILKEQLIPIKCWNFDFSEREYFGDSTHEYTMKFIERVSVCGKNYLKVSDELTSDKTRDIRVSISGIDAQNNLINFGEDIGIGIFPAPPGQKRSIPLCGAICDGNWLGEAYAYDNRLWGYIDENEDLTGMGFISSIGAYRINQDNLEIPFYGYYTPAQASIWVSQNYPNNTIQTLHSISPVDFSGLLNTANLAPGVTIKDPNNNYISGSYYMIRKDFGPWNDFDAYMKSSDFLLPYCNFSLNYSINIINSSSTLISNGGPALVCYGNGFSLSTGENDVFNSDCLPSILNNVVDMSNSPFDILNQIDDCLDGGDSNPWWENLDYAELVPFDYTTDQTSPIWSYSGIESTGSSVLLNEGLYWFTAHSKKGNYYPVIIDAKETFSFSLLQKDLVNVIIFPVPHNDDFYSMNISAPFSGEMLYELHDSNGEVLFKQNIEFKTTSINNPYTIKIEPNQTLPSGILIHKFTMGDGSIYTQITNKN
jgi:hypothetical protein